MACCGPESCLTTTLTFTGLRVVRLTTAGLTVVVGISYNRESLKMWQVPSLLDNGMPKSMGNLVTLNPIQDD